MEQKGIIYKWTCKITGLSYIGQTINPEGRYKSRVRLLGKKPKIKNKFLITLYKYSNLEDWDYSILEDNVDRKFLNDREIYWIKSYDSFNNGYNSTSGGNQKWKSISHPITIETRNKISNTLKNHEVTLNTREKISKKLKGREGLKGENNGMFGKHLSEEAKNKISITSKGKKLSEETKRKISDKHKGKVISEETREKISKGKKGQTPWNKGQRNIIKHTEETKKIISKKNKGKNLGKSPFSKGKHKVWNDENDHSKGFHYE